MQTPSLPATLSRWRRITLSAFYGLLVILFVNALTFTTGLAVTTLVIWVMQAIPLLIFIRALHRNQIRAYAWLSFVVLIYFVHGVLNLFNPEKVVIGAIESFICCVLFTALVIYIRQFKRHFKLPV